MLLFGFRTYLSKSNMLLNKKVLLRSINVLITMLITLGHPLFKRGVTGNVTER